MVIDNILNIEFQYMFLLMSLIKSDVCSESPAGDDIKSGLKNKRQILQG